MNNIKLNDNELLNEIEIFECTIYFYITIYSNKYDIKYNVFLSYLYQNLNHKYDVYKKINDKIKKNIDITIIQPQPNDIQILVKQIKKELYDLLKVSDININDIKLFSLLKNYIYYNLKIYNEINYNDDIKKYLKDNIELKNYIHKLFLNVLYDTLKNNRYNYDEIKFLDNNYIYLNYDIYKYIIELNIDQLLLFDDKKNIKSKLNIFQKKNILGKKYDDDKINKFFDDYYKYHEDNYNNYKGKIKYKIKQNKDYKNNKKIYEQKNLEDFKLFDKYNNFLNDLTTFIYIFFIEINIDKTSYDNSNYDNYIFFFNTIKFYYIIFKELYIKDENKNYDNIEFILKWILYIYSEIINKSNDEDYFRFNELIFEIEKINNIENDIIKKDKRYLSEVVKDISSINNKVEIYDKYIERYVEFINLIEDIDLKYKKYIYIKKSVEYLFLTIQYIKKILNGKMYTNIYNFIEFRDDNNIIYYKDLDDNDYDIVIQIYKYYNNIIEKYEKIKNFHNNIKVDKKKILDEDIYKLIYFRSQTIISKNDEMDIKDKLEQDISNEDILKKETNDDIENIKQILNYNEIDEELYYLKKDYLDKYGKILNNLILTDNINSGKDIFPKNIVEYIYDKNEKINKNIIKIENITIEYHNVICYIETSNFINMFTTTYDKHLYYYYNETEYINSIYLNYQNKNYEIDTYKKYVEYIIKLRDIIDTKFTNDNDKIIFLDFYLNILNYIKLDNTFSEYKKINITYNKNNKILSLKHNFNNNNNYYIFPDGYIKYKIKDKNNNYEYIDITNQITEYYDIYNLIMGYYYNNAKNNNIKITDFTDKITKLHETQLLISYDDNSFIYKMYEYYNNVIKDNIKLFNLSSEINYQNQINKIIDDLNNLLPFKNLKTKKIIDYYNDIKTNIKNLNNYTFDLHYEYHNILQNIDYKLNNYKLQIKDFLRKYVPNLNNNDFNLLFELYYCIINYIIIKFNINNVNKFYLRLINNNNQDLIMIYYLLIPYNKYNNDYKSFNDISLYEENNKYKYTNIQYSRFYDNKNNMYYTPNLDNYIYDKKNDIYLYKYNSNDVIINFNLLLKTIDIISNKLYIEWIDILPINFNEYKNTDLYKNTYKYNEQTQKFIDNKNNIMTLHENINYNGLYIGDIYNSILHNLVIEPTEYLWLLLYYDDNYILDCLNNNIKINDFINTKNDLNEDEMKIFEIKFYKFIDEIYKLDNEYFLNWIKYFLIYFEKTYDNYDKKIKNIEGYKQISDNNDDNYLQTFPFKIKNKKYLIDNEEIKIEKDNIKKYYDTVTKIINIDHIYNYLKKSLVNFSKTFYGRKILKIYENSNLKDHYIYSMDINKQLNHNNFLNYYYFFYSYFIISKKYINKNTWDFIADKYKLNFINFLNQDYKTYNNVDYKFIYFDDFIKQINFFNYDTNKIDIDNIGVYINTIKENVIDFVFESMIYNGILTKLNIEELNDKEYLKQNNNDRIKVLNKNILDNKNNLEYVNYATNDKFKDMSVKKIPYLENIVKSGDNWPVLFAFDWVSQINFYHHYINNRMMMITAGTGQGKSTQVPKLLYYSHLIIYNKKPKVICSQPRIAPSQSNPNYISRQLGLSINDDDKEDIIHKFIQYQNSLVTKSFNTSNYIRYVTDGLLYEKVIDNMKLIDKKNDEENLYDCIIIDESHEHNTNMDMLLTLLRISLILNKKIKICIVSATMEYDDNIIRRYYNCIDEDLTVPFNYNILNKIDNHYNITKNVVDKHIHIAPPGSITNFKVDEIYLDFNPLTYKDAEEEGIKILKKIVNNGLSGNILFFSITKKIIDDLVILLNTILPPFCLALPFYSGIPGNFLSNIISGDIKPQDIEIDKKYIFDFAKGIYVNYTKVPKNTYTKIILIATNVAEASLTFDNLKYVIDSGFVNSNIYIKDNLVNDIVSIREDNRIQRKGRVGRTSSGTVYYLYKKNSKINVQRLFNISIEDIDDKIYKIIPDNNKIINTSKLYSYYYDDIKNKIINTISKDIIEKFIFIYNNLNLYNPNINIIDIIKGFNGKNGFTYNLIIDNICNFYFIHPEENIITRNKYNGLVENHTSQKIINIIINLINNNKIINNDDDYYKFIKNDNYVILEKLVKDIDNKTKERKIEIKEFDIYMLKLLIYSIKYDCLDYMLLLLPFHHLGYDIKGFFKDKFKDDFINIHIKEYGNNSLLYLLLEITSYFIKIINYPFKNDKEYNFYKYDIKKYYPKNIFLFITEKYNIDHLKIIYIVELYYFYKNIFNNIINENANKANEVINNINIINKSLNPLNNLTRCFLSVYPYFGYLDDNIFYDYTCNKYNIKKLKYIKYNKCFISYIKKEIKLKNNIFYIELVCPNVIDENTISETLFTNINVKLLNKYVFNPVINKYNYIHKVKYNLYNENIINHIKINNNNNQFDTKIIPYVKETFETYNDKNKLLQINTQENIIATIIKKEIIKIKDVKLILPNNIKSKVIDWNKFKNIYFPYLTKYEYDIDHIPKYIIEANKITIIDNISYDIKLEEQKHEFRPFYEIDLNILDDKYFGKQNIKNMLYYKKINNITTITKLNNDIYNFIFTEDNFSRYLNYGLYQIKIGNDIYIYNNIFTMNDDFINIVNNNNNNTNNNNNFYINLYNFIKHIKKCDKYTKHFNFYIQNNYVDNNGNILINHNDNETPDIDFYLFNYNNIYNNNNNCNNIKLNGLFENKSNDKLQIFIYYEKLLNNTYKFIYSYNKLYDSKYYYYMVIEKKNIL